MSGQHHGIHFGLDFRVPSVGTVPPARGKSSRVDMEAYPVLDEVLEGTTRQELDFACMPMMQNHNFEPFGRSEKILSVTSWCSMIVGKVATWSDDFQIDYDSKDPAIAGASCEILKKEMAYAAHSTLPAVLIDLPPKASPNLARIIISTLLKSMYLNVWIRVPLTLECDNQNPDNDTAWLLWNSLRTLCQNHNRLGVVLEVTENLPCEKILNRWIGEPLKGVVINTELFTFGHQRAFSLPQKHLDFLTLLMRYKVQVIFAGDVHPRLAAAGRDLSYYKNYVVNLKANINQTAQEMEEAAYHDYLQAPLQPLMDNLESQTYEVFEKDPIKYRQYEEAAFAALTDMASKQRTIVVMVVGAGRGPLVKGAINAGLRSKVPIKVYAVEKNPNAIVCLRGLLREKDWNGNVEIIESDMRVWDAPVKADIMISELLGSFGDNELSPECLDGAERFLASDGVMIPQSYRSYLAPLQSHKLHTDVLAYDDLTHIETAYVVKIHAGHIIAPPKECFEYIHPKPPAPYPQKNDRMLSLEFEVYFLLSKTKQNKT